jgi:putative neutral zinc metallopeptidase
MPRSRILAALVIVPMVIVGCGAQRPETVAATPAPVVTITSPSAVETTTTNAAPETVDPETTDAEEPDATDEPDTEDIEPEENEPTSQCTEGSLENCYSFSGMQNFYDAAIKFVNDFLAGSYRSMPRPSHYYYIDSGDSMDSPCGGSDDSAYEYCPVSRSVYLGQDQLWKFYHEAGDAAAVVGLSHELGHHIQEVVGVPRSSIPRLTIPHENQADCVAGAFISYADRQGWLEPDDIGDIETMLEMIASSEGPTRDHGTLSERTEAMERGASGGLYACNAYYPATPLIS